jgi:hypothetical protein
MGRTTTFNEAFESMNVRVADFFRSLTESTDRTASRRLLGSLAEETDRQAAETVEKWNVPTDTETLNRAFSRTRGMLPFLMGGGAERYANALASESGILQLAILVKRGSIAFLREMESLAGTASLRQRVREAMDAEFEHLHHFLLLLVIGRQDSLSLPR